MKLTILNKKQIFGFLLTSLALGFILFFLATSYIIGESVKKLCFEAKSQYSGDCPKALISLLNDHNQSFNKRNQAIWALGQLGDSRALKPLQKYYTGVLLKKESLHQTISQYELKKAINLTSGGINIAAWAWRYRIKP